MSLLGPKVKIVVLFVMFALLAIDISQKLSAQEMPQFGLDPNEDDTELRDQLIRSGFLVNYEDFMRQLPQSRQSTPLDSPFGARPSQFDWTKIKNAVSPVKNQANCLSCVTFATLANIESLYSIYRGIQLDLSEEQIIECREDDSDPCDTASPYLAAGIINRLGGVTKEQHIPYKHRWADPKDVKHGCPATKPSWPKYGVNKYVQHRGRTEEQMQQWLIDFGPFMVGIMGGALRNSGDKIISQSCNVSKITHAVLVVGFGERMVNGQTVPYWKVKNSWGVGVGERGYHFIERGTNSICFASKMGSVILKEMMHERPQLIWSNASAFTNTDYDKTV